VKVPAKFVLFLLEYKAKNSMQGIIYNYIYNYIQLAAEFLQKSYLYNDRKYGGLQGEEVWEA
jgi:hypothetical protein